MNKKYKAFTLIELLVVIAIIGILSGFIFVSMNGATSAAKDARRKADLATIQHALLAYQAAGNTLPTTACTLGVSNCLSEVLSNPPTDQEFPTKNYTYTPNGNDFTLSGTLSNDNTYSYTMANGWREVSGAWLTGYAYRKSHLITGSTAGIQTNYQIKFIVHRGTGTDSGQDIYIATTKLDATYKDLRFTSDDKSTLLDYWIESSDTNSATVWVEVASIPASPATATIYVYYGNASAVAVSNGDNTFYFFDDFNGGALDTGKWTINGATISGGILTCLRAQDITGKTLYGVNYAIGTRSQITSGGGASYGVFGWILPSGGQYTAQIKGHYPTASTFNMLTRNPYPTESNVNLGNLYNTYYVWDIIRNGSTSYIANRNNVLAGTITTNVPTVSMYPMFQQDDVSGVGNVNSDWIFVRKYISPEPIHSTYSFEESNI